MQEPDVVSVSFFLCGDRQVIVTTPMEMLKIQLQDAGRIGERPKKDSNWNKEK